MGDGRRKRTRAFTELQSHYLCDDRFGRPGKGMVGYMRRNFLVPVPSFESFEALNAHLERRCMARMGFAPKVLVESKVIGLNQKSGANVVHLILILYSSSLGSPSSLR